MDKVEKETFFKPVKGIHNPRAAITFGGEALGTSSLKPLYGQEQIKEDHRQCFNSGLDYMAEPRKCDELNCVPPANSYVELNS